jgi:amino acid transporter
VRSVGLIVVGSILAGGIYYALAALSAGMAGPWQQVSQQELPAAAACRLAFGSEFFARFVLVSGLFGIVTVGNACSIACSRLLFSLSRARCLGPTFLRLHATYGSPVPAIVFATIFGAAGTLLGRGGIAPIVNVGSAAACFGYLVAAVSLIRLRRTDPGRARSYRVPGGVFTAGAAALFSLLLLYSAVRQNWIDAGGTFPIEWAVMLTWAVVGVALYRWNAPVRAQMPAELRRSVMIGDAQA